MDAFFAAVEDRDHLEWRGLPLVVGADPREGRGRGVVSTANYPARRYGIHSGMPISRAWELAEAARRRKEPGTIFVTPNFRRYAEFSRRIMALIRRHVPMVQEVGIDEAYLDLGFCESYETARELCRKIKEEIEVQEGLTASVGIGPNKLVAKIASDHEKPDGLTVVKAEEAEDFLAPLPIRVIPGVGPKTEQFLTRHGVRKAGDLKKFTPGELESLLGKWGLALYEKARGGAVRSSKPPGHPSLSANRKPIPRIPWTWGFFSTASGTCAGGCTGALRRKASGPFAPWSSPCVSRTSRRTPVLTPWPVRPIPCSVLMVEAMRLFMPFLDRRENPQRKLIRLLGVRLEKLAV